MILEVQSVTAGYTPGLNVLNDVSIKVDEGRVTAILGPNGAGKSTLLKAVMGFLKPSSGRIRFKGADIAGMEPHEIAKLGVMYLAQRRSVFPHLTVRENLELDCWLHRGNKVAVQNSLASVYLSFPILKQKENLSSSTLSGGEQRMLELARATATKPELLLIDEPSFGLAPKISRQVYQTLMEFKEQGKSILLVDQNVKEAISLADYVYVLELGTNSREGSKGEFASNLEGLIRDWLRI